MYVIGISGQTGAGKTTAAEILSEAGLGYNLEADRVGHIILGKDSVKECLCENFGKDILDIQGNVERKTLGRKVFSCEENVKKLNDITHPEIISYIKNFIDKKKYEGCKFLLLNAALLYQTGLDKLCDFIIYISADPNIRLKRLMEKRGMSEKDAAARLFSQDPKPEASDKVFVIENNSSEEKLKTALMELRTVLERNCTI